MLMTSRSPLTKHQSNGDGLFQIGELKESIFSWTDYFIWGCIILFVALFLYNSSKVIYGMVAKNGEVQKSSIWGAMLSLIALLILRLGFILFLAITVYGVNRFLLDLVNFIAANALYLSAGVLALSAFFFFINRLINHPGIRRRAIQFSVGSLVLIGISFVVPFVFLQV